MSEIRLFQKKSYTKAFENYFYTGSCRYTRELYFI